VAPLLTAAELADLQADFLTLLTDTADVYAEDPTSGGFTVLVHGGLACELTRQKEAGASYGADLPTVEQWRLLYDPAYDLSYDHQLQIGGNRYDVVAGSSRPERAAGGGGVAALNGCDVVRARWRQ
jgi:hypothetical protein